MTNLTMQCHCEVKQTNGGNTIRAGPAVVLLWLFIEWNHGLEVTYVE